MTNETEVRGYGYGEHPAQAEEKPARHKASAASQNGPGAAVRDGIGGRKHTVRGGIGEAFRVWVPDTETLRRVTAFLLLAALSFLLCGAFAGNGEIGGKPMGIALLCACGSGFPAVFTGVTAAVLRTGDMRGLYLSSILLAAGLRYLAGRLLAAGESSDAEEFDDGDGGGLSAIGNDPYTGDAPPRVRSGWEALRRGAFPSGLFVRDSVSVRVGCAFASACPVTAGILLAGEFAPEAVIGAVVYFFALPVFCFLFCGLSPDTMPAPAHREAGIGALAYAVTASFGNLVLFGFSVRLIAAYLVTLYIAKNGGFLRGGLCGLLCGLACDGLYAPAYALAGAVSGVLFGVHPAPAVICSVLSASLYAVSAGAFPALRLVVPELLAAGAVSYPLARYGRIPDVLYAKNPFRSRSVPPAVLGEEAPVQDSGDGGRVPPERLGLPGLDEQLDALSGILSGLSAAFYHLSDYGKKPGLSEVRQLCESTAAQFCSVCPMRETCWEKDFSATADAMGRITLCVQRKGHAEVSAAFAPLDKRCPSLAKMLAEINEASGALCEERLAHDRIGVAAADYEGMSGILRAVAEENGRSCTEDRALSRRMQRAMARMGFRAQHVAVYGERRRVVVASGIDMGLHAVGETGPGTVAGRALLGSEELRDAFSALAGVRYQLPDYSLNPTEDGTRSLVMTMRALPKFEVHCGFSGEKKEGEEVTGDALSCFANRGDYFHILLCDGMGSGREASVTSQISTLFLEKLLSVCDAHGAALRLLNGFLRSRTGECSASVDLCSVDTLTGDAVFVKCGAAASYLIRGDSIFRIASGTMPLGILQEVNAEETAFPLCDGDILLFCSDGVCQDDEDAQWILRTARIALRMGCRNPDLLSAGEKEGEAPASGGRAEAEKKKRNSLDRAAEQFLRAAKDRHPERTDDRTAVFVRIREVKETDIA